MSDTQEKLTANQVKESDTETVKWLTPTGIDIQTSTDLELKMNIARELKTTFPAITPFRVGKLLSLPNDEITVSGYQKRGRKFLGLTPRKKKEES